MSVSVHVVDCGSRKVPELAAMLRAAGARTRVVKLSEVDGLEPADAVVVSGGPHLFTEDPALIDDFAFLDTLVVPVLGICLGHQALGMRDGARVYLGEARRDDEVILLRGEHAIWRGLEPSAVFREDHCEGIDLPPGWRLLASSEHYPVEAMAHLELPRIGVQFHPEVSGENGRLLLQSFVDFARTVSACPTSD